MREISIEGCEVIGEGGYGKVYKIDSETIVKVYNSRVSLEFIEQERNTSQRAFLLGMPTAISYDVVKCGDNYGVVYEMIDAKTMAQIINKEPGRISEMPRKAAELLRELHKIVPGSDSKLSNRKQAVLNGEFQMIDTAQLTDFDIIPLK